jgi:hypothetical protein
MDSKDVSANWVLSSITPELQDTLGVGNSRMLSAEYVLSAQADTGIIIPYPEVRFNDVLTSNFVDTSFTLVAFDSVRVIQPAALRIDRLVLTDALAPNRPRVNEKENFILNMAVSNLGADSAKSVYITLLMDGTPLPDGQYFIPSIAPYDSAFIDMTRNITTARVEPYRFTTRIDSAFDVTTGDNISIAQPIDNREDIIADVPALLIITSVIARPSGALDGIVSVGQQFEIDATTTNDGTAPYSSGLLRLTVPANYSLLTPDTIRYSETNPVNTWRIMYNDSTTGPGSDNFVITLEDSSLDLNINRTAQLDTSFTTNLQVRSVPAGDFTISAFIDGPAGAQDDTLSTGQVFTFKTGVGFPGSVEASGRVAQLLLPAGYSVTDSTIISLADSVASDTVYWDIIAKNSVDNKLDSIRVRVFGTDINSGETVENTSAPITVTTVMRAELLLNASITAPAGATDGRVSVGQNFDLSAIIGNRGTAGIMAGSTGQVSIQLPANLDLPSGNFIQNFDFGQPVVWVISVDSLSSPSEIFVRFESTPADENSEQPASTVNDSVVVLVLIEEAGSIAVKEVTPDNSTVSSGQVFIVSTSYDLTDNVEGATATISVPPDFMVSPTEQGIIPDSTLTLNWTVTAPLNITNDRDYDISFTAGGFDRNDSSPIQGGDTTISVTVQPRARVMLNAEILSPASAITRNTVSRGQIFEIRTAVSRDWAGLGGMAGITGSTEVTAFYDSQFELEGDSIRTVAQWDDSITWRFRAPEVTMSASSFSFSITQAPLDVNSNTPAAVAGDNGARSFALSVTQENLVITNITDTVLDTLGIDNNNFSEGSENVPLMIFTASYPGSSSDTTTIKMDGVRLKFLEPIDDQEMNPNRVVSLIESITISNMQYFADSVAADYQKPARRFITFTVPDTMTNPVDIDWNPPNIFLADSTDTVVVMVSFRKGAQHQSFRMALEDVYAYDVNPDLNLTAVDEDLTPLPESTLLTTARVSIVPSDPEEAFITYPNPFGKNQDYANIKFILESGGDVEIRMFTLVGELVWTRIVQGETPGVHDGAYETQYRWDGKNDKGYTVLNGVYLCVIRLKENNGETKTYTKKVAYIK